MKLVISVAVLFALAINAFPQAKSTATVKQIDAYVRTIDGLAKRQTQPDFIVADVSDYEIDKPKWQVFKTEKELEKFREKTETYTIANNWRSKGNLVLSIFTTFSPSGDWAQYITHYFRPDGSAAKVTSELRTFYGHYIVIREVYLDMQGKSLKKSTKYLDLTTQKPKKPNADLLGDNPVLSENVFYKKVSRLPFYSLTKSKI